MSTNEIHIASLIVHVMPCHLFETQKQIQNLQHAEVHGIGQEGKIIVVLESESQGLITKTIDKICDLPNVLNAALVYHEIDQDMRLDEENRSELRGHTGDLLWN